MGSRGNILYGPQPVTEGPFAVTALSRVRTPSTCCFSRACDTSRRVRENSGETL
jgi:hypothetical protein